MNNKTVIFDLRHLPDAKLAAARVAGLPALDRTMLALQRKVEGDDERNDPLYRQAIVLAPREEMTRLNKTAAVTPRIKMDLCWIEDDSQSLDMVLKSNALGSGTREVLYWPGDLTFGRLLPQLVEGEAPVGGALAAAGDAEGLALLPVEVLEQHRGLSPADLLEALDGEGKVERVEPEEVALRLREIYTEVLARQGIALPLREQRLALAVLRRHRHGPATVPPRGEGAAASVALDSPGAGTVTP